jgi:TetR/AcrR family transcriptional repressor of bet genes
MGMPKIGMEEVRRRQLVNATLELIREGGVAGASVSQISARAGLANGMVHHYFTDKDALFEAALEELVKRIYVEVFALLKLAKTPLDRVIAFVEGNLSEASFTPENVAGWLAFWALVPHSPTLQRIHNIVARRTQSAMTHAISKLMNRAQAAQRAKAITIYIDGLWLRAAVDVGGLTRDDARALAYDFLSQQLGVAVRPP